MSVWDLIGVHTDEIEQKINDNAKASPIIHGGKKAIIKDTNITVYITPDGTYIKTKEIAKENFKTVIKKLESYFTIKNKNIMGYLDITNCFYYVKDTLFIPRFGAHLLKNKFNTKFINSIKSNNYIPIMKYSGKHNGNQEIVYNEIMNNYYNKSSKFKGLTLLLDAGQGKTFLAMSLIGTLKLRTLIVTHNTSIKDQTINALKQNFTGITIGELGGKKKIYGDVIVAIINTAAMDNITFKNKEFKTSKDFYKTIDFIIFDESHEYCSKTRSKIFKNCNAMYSLGLSATPEERTDGLDKVHLWNIGPILDASKLEGYTEADIPFKGRVTCIKYSGPPDYTKHLMNEKLEMTSTTLMIDQLSKDMLRTKLIVKLALEHSKTANLFIFADRRSYLELINKEMKKQHLDAHYLTSDIEYKQLETIRLVGGSTTEDMNFAEQKCSIILTTYQFLGTGKSIPKMTSILLATPRKSKSKQFIGRIFRLGSNYSIERQIIDIVDWKTSLKSQWYKRKEYYDGKEFPIDEKKISFRDL